MEVIENIDLFLEKQPEKNFSERLCAPLHAEKPIDFDVNKKSRNFINFSKVNLILNFPDPENLLEYTYADFRSFLNSCNIKEAKSGLYIKLKIKKLIAASDESFMLSVNKNGCTVYAKSTKGIRRALIFIEDEMKRQCGPLLPLGKTLKSPSIETRISRCFFTPPSHASAEGSINELCSEIDYYPNEYLNRLAHDGINGLWIGSSFRKMLKSNIITEYGKEQDIQIPKLNSIIKKCKKFGIDIYLFVTEPASSHYSKEILNYPEMIGGITPKPSNLSLLCPSSEKTKLYIKESITNLFTLAPDLAGLINITVGESLSACGSTSELFCSRCKENYGSLANTLVATEKMFVDAMKEIAPNAKFISWTYAQRQSEPKMVEEACLKRDTGVIHMQNFEDLGEPVQLGKKRLACDYWLSYVGPGKLMRRTVNINKQRNVQTFAKIQVCSSHEISTVPYIPVPGILYDKFKFMHENEIVGVMQCWYFGNYPSIMNKSAHELAFVPYFETKKKFLIHLAKTYFGKNYRNAVKAWEYFEKGYKNFPVNLAFEWVGPMQDSPCCPLHLIPVDWPMPGTWLKSERSGGDRIGECLLNGHTIDEAIVLVEKMCKHWQTGLSFINQIPLYNSEIRKEQISNARAIGLIFSSGLNCLKFYKLRHLLGTGQGGMEILEQLKKIVHEEISNSTNLLPIVIADNRIGYHSEANGYKIFPEKLKWRIESLKNLLETEFKDVEARMTKGLLPLPFYYGLNNGSVRKIIKEHVTDKDWMFFTQENGEQDNNTALRIFEDGTGCHVQIKVKNLSDDEITIKPEFNIMFPSIPIKIINGKFKIEWSNAFSVPPNKVKNEESKFEFGYETNLNEQIFTLSFKREIMNMAKNEPFRLGVFRDGNVKSTLLPATKYFAHQLIRGEFSPEHYCFFVKEQAFA